MVLIVDGIGTLFSALHAHRLESGGGAGRAVPVRRHRGEPARRLPRATRDRRARRARDHRRVRHRHDPLVARRGAATAAGADRQGARVRAGDVRDLAADDLARLRARAVGTGEHPRPGRPGYARCAARDRRRRHLPDPDRAARRRYRFHHPQHRRRDRDAVRHRSRRAAADECAARAVLDRRRKVPAAEHRHPSHLDDGVRSEPVRARGSASACSPHTPSSHWRSGRPSWPDATRSRRHLGLRTHPARCPHGRDRSSAAAGGCVSLRCRRSPRSRAASRSWPCRYRSAICGRPGPESSPPPTASVSTTGSVGSVGPRHRARTR